MNKDNASLKGEAEDRLMRLATNRREISKMSSTADNWKKKSSNVYIGVICRHRHLFSKQKTLVTNK